MLQSSNQKGVVPPFLAFLLVALAGVSLCAQTLTLSPRSDHPTARITVQGTGFAPAAAITVAFGRAVAPVVSDGSGAFQTQIQVPATAQPGLHRVTAKSGTTVLAKTGFLVRTNWREFGFGPAGGRFNPHENTLSVSNVPGLQMLWSFTTGSGERSSPAVANGVVYVGSGDHNVYALNANTGALLWSFATGRYGSSPAVADGAVYVGGAHGKVYAFGLPSPAASPEDNPEN